MAPRQIRAAVRNAVRRLERSLVRPVGVLAYHRIAEPARDPWELAVSRRHFDEQLALLSGIGRIEHLDVLLATRRHWRHGSGRPRFALTFDDGYVDNLDVALPILELHEAPATIFIATGLLDQPAFWWDMLAELVLGAGPTGCELVVAATELGLLEHCATDPCDVDRATAHGLLYDALVRLGPSEIMPLVAALADRLGVPPPVPSARPMTTDELHRLASHPLVTIGVHTVNHPRLTLLSSDAIRTELTECARRLDELIGAQHRVLAYPFGVTSRSVADVALATGITDALTTDSRWVDPREDPMFVPRLHAPDLGGDAFRGWVERTSPR